MKSRSSHFKASRSKALLLAVALACALVFGGACNREVRGTFAWASNDDRGIQEPERSLLLATEFRIGREDLYFFDYESIWWIYQIQGGSYEANGFLAALYENNLTPDPVEVDLRRVPIQRDGCCDYIRQYYEDLAPGRYLLKIAHNSQVVDQVEFYVVPPEGPAGIEAERNRPDQYGGSDIEDFDGVTDAFESGPESASPPGEETDDILRYSS
ncbi:MAG: hypothetical protein NXI24_02950 [bacterium]|nr:hypothetical protein [bacterium]